MLYFCKQMAIRLYYEVELYPYAVAQVKSAVEEIEYKIHDSF